MLSIFIFLIYEVYAFVQASPCDGIVGGEVVVDKCVWLSPVIDKVQKEARAYCNSIKPGADLVVIDTPKKKAAIQGLIASMPATNEAWIGLQDMDPHICRDWRWVYGRPITAGSPYINWRSGQPNGYSIVNPGSAQGFQDCTIVRNDNTLEDRDCGSTFYPTRALCECCFGNENQISKSTKFLNSLKFKRNSRPDGSDKGKLLKCAVQCQNDPSCCGYMYNTETNQCEYNNLLEPSSFLRVNADHP